MVSYGAFEADPKTPFHDGEVIMRVINVGPSRGIQSTILLAMRWVHLHMVRHRTWMALVAHWVMHLWGRSHGGRPWGVITRTARTTRKAWVSPRIIAEEVSLQALKDMQVISKCAGCSCRLSQKLDCLVEKSSQQFLIHISVKNRIAECSWKNQQVAPLSARSLVFRCQDR
jgi:hypothetical protein